MWHAPAWRPLPLSEGDGKTNGAGGGDEAPRQTSNTLQPADESEHWIVSHIRRAYTEVAEEPLPETFQTLLRRLHERHSTRQDGND